jgi:hypothetical protein
VKKVKALVIALFLGLASCTHEAETCEAGNNDTVFFIAQDDTPPRRDTPPKP